MIRIYLAAVILTAALLYRFPAARYEAPPAIGVQCQALLSDSPYQTLIQEPRPRFVSRGAVEDLPSDHSYFVPPLGQGYIEYSKIGKEIAYYVRPDELYWKRDSASYPVTDLEGRLILLLSGDLTAVRLMDRNGNMASAAPFSGMLMTDFAFANDWPVPEKKEEQQPAAAVLFSGGPVYLITYGTSVQSYRLELPGAEKTFAKSVALSAGRIAVHLQEPEGDFVRVYTVKEKKDGPVLVERSSMRLPFPFPHRISLAIVEGGVLFSSGMRTGRLNENGGVDWSADGAGPVAAAEPESPGPPRVDFQGDSYKGLRMGAVGNGALLTITDEPGWPLAFGRRNGGPFRLLPAVEARAISAENGQGSGAEKPRPADEKSTGNSSTEAGHSGFVIEDRHGYCRVGSL